MNYERILFINWILMNAAVNVNRTPYSVHRTMYTVHCTLYTVHCTMYTVHCILYNSIDLIVIVLLIN